MKALRPFDRRPPSSPRGGSGLPRPSPAGGGAVPRGFPGATLPAAPTPGTGRAREVGQTSLWRRTALGPLSAPAPPPEVGGEPSLHPPSVAPAARLEPPPQATGTYWPGLLGRRAHLARDGRGCGALVATHPPLRPGAAGWASGIPAGSPLPRGSFWPSPFLRGSTPRRFRYSPSGEAFFPLSGESPRLRPSPQLAPRPALRVEAPRVPVQAFGPRRRDVALRDTAGQQVPRREPLRSAYSPGLPLWCGRLSL